MPNEDKIVAAVQQVLGTAPVDGVGAAMPAPPLDGEQALRLLATMWRIRLFEERVGRAHARRRGPRADPPQHRAGGRRGRRSARSCATTTPSTRATARTGTRSRRARRSSASMAELMGRDGGLCRGLGGSMHLVDVEHGFMGATGVVGGNIPIALGSALAARLRGERLGRGRLLRRRRRAGRPLQRDGEPRDALGAAARSSSARTTASPSSRRARRTRTSSA